MKKKKYTITLKNVALYASGIYISLYILLSFYERFPLPRNPRLYDLFSFTTSNWLPILSFTNLIYLLSCIIMIKAFTDLEKLKQSFHNKNFFNLIVIAFLFWFLSINSLHLFKDIFYGSEKLLGNCEIIFSDIHGVGRSTIAYELKITNLTTNAPKIVPLSGRLFDDLKGTLKQKLPIDIVGYNDIYTCKQKVIEVTYLPNLKIILEYKFLQ